MRYRRIPDSDSLFRHCIHPLSFKNQGKRFASEKLLHLQDGQEQGKGTLLGSLAWEWYVPTTKHVHAYGCRVASYMNKNLRSGSHKKRQKRQKRRIYCGAYRLNGSAVRALATTDGLNEISSADVVHHIENEEIAHTDLRISLNPGILDVEGTKTVIVDRLWNTCSGPLKHIADCDRDVNPHPSSDLSTPPAGPYSDTRSYLHRLWSLIRFRIYSLVWRMNTAGSP